MDNQQAKFILQSYRPRGQDAKDPVFSEALERARLDPEVERWLIEERELDILIGDKLRSVSVPADVRSTILAAQDATDKRARWFRPLWLAAAAAVVLLIGIAGVSFWPRPTPGLTYAVLWDEVTRFATTKFTLSLQSKDMDTMQRWLAEHGAPGNVDLPTSLAGLPAMGCHTFEVRGHKVSLFCFVADGKEMVHVFVIERGDLSDPPSGEAPQFAHRNDWMTASWSKGKFTYILASTADSEALRSLL